MEAEPPVKAGHALREGRACAAGTGATECAIGREQSRFMESWASPQTRPSRQQLPQPGLRIYSSMSLSCVRVGRMVPRRHFPRVPCSSINFRSMLFAIRSSASFGPFRVWSFSVPSAIAGLVERFSRCFSSAPPRDALALRRRHVFVPPHRFPGMHPVVVVAVPAHPSACIVLCSFRVSVGDGDALRRRCFLARRPMLRQSTRGRMRSFQCPPLATWRVPDIRRHVIGCAVHPLPPARAGMVSTVAAAARLATPLPVLGSGGQAAASRSRGSASGAPARSGIAGLSCQSERSGAADHIALQWRGDGCGPRGRRRRSSGRCALRR